MTQQILLLPGDGIGTEIMAEVARIADAIGDLVLETDLVGGVAIDAHGVPLHGDTLIKAREADAIVLGAVGGPKWVDQPFENRPEAGLLALRKELDLFANLRPAICFSALADASSLKRELVEGLDLMIVRELVGGVYFGEPRGIETMADGSRVGFNTQRYSDAEIQRIGRVAFELAAKRGGCVTSAEKSNVMESGLLWRQEMTALHASEFSHMALDHMLADNCAMQLLKNPKQFDVIVTDNLFGDILSDEAAMLTGSLGLLPSASIGATSLGLYEPVHGSAPDIAGRGVANPIAAISTLSMALRYSLDRGSDADALDAAVEAALEAGARTGDIAKADETVMTTSEMGNAVLKQLG